MTAITAGTAHTCALTSAGGVKCWGSNLESQLGDPSARVDYRRTPVDVHALTSGVTAIAAGGAHSCALTDPGGVKCWGYNGFGELGDGTECGEDCSSPFPTDVHGLVSGVTAIATGGHHSCALTDVGAVKCWGYDAFGELGDGRGGFCAGVCHSSTPVDVRGLTGGVTAIAAGTDHTCALTSGGEVMCWGDNRDGELGDGTTTDRFTPVTVVGLGTGIKTIAAGGEHTCALAGGGGVKCWGRNTYGRLGDGSTRRRATPVDVRGLTSGVVALSAGGEHTCAIATAGIACWGRNVHGQLGEGTRTDSNSPIGVIGFGGTVNCAVPDLLGKPLAEAKTTIRLAHCRIGAVTRVASSRRKNIVVRQTPRPGRRLTSGARVNLQVSRGT